MPIRKTVLGGFAAACLLFGGASQVGAQSPQVQSDEVEAIQVLNNAAVATALGTQPIAPEQLALGDRFVKAMNLRGGLDRTMAAIVSPMREQILQSIAGQPPERKAKFMAAVDESLAAVLGDSLDKVMVGLTRYYAARLTASQLTDALGVYETPVGQKAVKSPESLTEAEKEEMGRYVMNHPRFMEVLGAAGGSMTATQALTAREMNGLNVRLKARLCLAIKARGLNSPACSTT